MMLSFLSDTLKVLSQEIRHLTRKVKEYERAHITRESRGSVPSTRAKRKKKSVARKTKSPSATETVIKVIKRHKKGVDILTLKEKTGFDDKKTRNIVYRATRLGKITRKGRGIYICP